jgi:hypothetical protein
VSTVTLAFFQPPHRYALQSFLKLIDTTCDEAFQCPICRHLPDHKKTIVIDGIVMGLQRSRRMIWKELPTEGHVESM